MRRLWIAHWYTCLVQSSARRERLIIRRPRLAVVKEPHTPRRINADIVHLDVEVDDAVIVLLLHVLQQADHNAFGQFLVNLSRKRSRENARVCEREAKKE